MWIFSLPPVIAVALPFVLAAELLDSAAGSYVGTAVLYQLNQLVFYAPGAPTGVGPGVPFVFKAGDRLTASGVVLT